jgi:hypothetical protein
VLREKISKNYRLITKLYFLFVASILLLISWNNKNINPICSDGAGYYEYLPAFFHYDDLWLENLEERGLNNWKNGLGVSCYYSEETNKNIILYPIGVSVLLSPFYFLAYALSLLFHQEIDPYSSIFQLLTRIGAIFYFILGSYLLMSKICKRFNCIKIIILFTLTITSTNVVSYIAFDSCFSHIYSFSFVCILISYLINYFSENTINFFHVGFILGILFLIRNTNIIFIVLLFPVFWDNYKLINFKNLISFNIPFFIIVLPQLIYNYYGSGKILFSAYSNLGKNFDKLSNPDIFNVLFSVNYGWFFWCPICLFSIFIGILNVKLNKGIKSILYISLLVITLQIYIVSSWYMQGFGSSYGHRGFVEYIPLTLIFLLLSSSFLFSRKYLTIFFLSFFTLISFINICIMKSYWKNDIPSDYKTLNNIILSLPFDIDDFYLKSASSIYQENKILLKYSEAKVCGIPSGHKSLNIDVYNQSGSYLMLNIFDINLAYRIFDSDFTLIEEYKPIERTTIGIVKPFGVKKLRINIELPEKVGLYYIKPCIVHENVKWCMGEAYVNPFIPCLVN